MLISDKIFEKIKLFSKKENDLIIFSDFRHGINPNKY